MSRLGWSFAVVLLSAGILCGPAAGGETSPDIAADLTGIFRSYMREARKTDAEPPLFPCEEELRCLADYFSRRYLASVVQQISDSALRGEPEAREVLRYGLRISKVFEYAAATTGPDRAVLTFVASDAKGVCLPLVRVHYRKELNVWRIDAFEEDSSEKQNCNRKKAIDSF